MTKTLYRFNCRECNVPIDTYWDDNEDGTTKGLLRGDYLLMGDFVFHNHCWDKFYERGVESIARESNTTKPDIQRGVCEEDTSLHKTGIFQE